MKEATKELKDHLTGLVHLRKTSNTDCYVRELVLPSNKRLRMTVVLADDATDRNLSHLADPDVDESEYSDDSTDPDLML